MDSERAHGIVLRRQPVTESSLLVTWFTREFGKLKTLAKGARRPKSPLAGKLDLFYEDELLFLPSRRSDLHLLQDCFLENPHPRLRETLASLTAASYAGELVELITAVEDPQPPIYELLGATLAALEEPRGPTGVLLVWLEVRLLAAAGWAPHWAAPGPAERVVQALGAAPVAGAQRVRLSAAQLAGVREVVWRLWEAEVGRTPRARRLVAERIGACAAVKIGENRALTRKDESL